MKIKWILIVCISLGSLAININAYALDTLTKIQLRNSYKQFEKCMQDAQNDITECFKEFNNAVDVRKKTLKKEPGNNDIKEALLTLINALYEIADTYYSTAEKKKGKDPGLSQKYYLKAAACYDQLIKLYPDEGEFKDRLKKAKYLARYEEVEGYILELKNRKRVDFALLTLQNLTSSRDSFNSLFGPNELLKKTIDEVVGQFADKVKRLFDATVNDDAPDAMKSLIYLIDTQSRIVDADDKQQYKITLAKMESQVIGIINAVVKGYRSEFEIRDSEYKKGMYTEAEKGFNKLLERTASFPDYSSASQSLQNRIAKTTNGFNVRQFRTDLQQKREVAKNTANFLSIVEEGKKAFNKKEWIASYNTFNKAIDFAKEQELAVNKDIPKEWLTKIQKQIDDLDENEIGNMEVANLHYLPMSYNQWLQLAKKGEFSKKYVSLSGKFQQQVGDIVILKDNTLEFDFFLETVFMGEKMNSVGLILKKKRLLQEGYYISCIGKFNDVVKFETVIGAEIQLPVFKVIWSSK